MKTKIVSTIIAILAVATVVLGYELWASTSELKSAKQEIEVRKEVWSKLRLLAGAYSGGVSVRVPGDREMITNRQIIIKHVKWETQEYIFSLDGTEAHLEQDGKDVDWSLIQNGLVQRW
jgi:hypothetical protein